MAKANGFGTGLAGVITGGTALASQAGLFNGGLFGNNCNRNNSLADMAAIATPLITAMVTGCHGNRPQYATKFDLEQAEKLSSKDATIAAMEGREAARAAGEQAFRDSVTFSQRSDDKITTVVGQLAAEAARNREYEARQGAEIECLQGNVTRLSGVVEKLATEIVDMGKREVELGGRVNCLATTTGMRFDAQSKEFQAGLSSVAGAAACEVSTLRQYCDATFVPGKLVMPLSSICPPAAPLCSCGSAAAALKGAASGKAANA